MAMGGKAQREITRAIANCQPFQNSTGSMRGTRGSTRELGWLFNHREHAKIKELLSRATYVVWSYNTPIGCVTETEDGNITKVYFDESHSATTSQHQSILRVGFSDFESIGEGPWTRRNQPRRASRRWPEGLLERRPFTRAPQPTEAPRDPEAEQQASPAQMLDPRYGDPDWTPWKTNGSNLPPEADWRDYERVRREGRRPVQ